MGEQPAPAHLERLAAVIRVGEPVIGARDHVQPLRVSGAIEEGPPVRGRYDLVPVGLHDENARDAGGRLRPRPPAHLGDQGRCRW